MSSPEVIERVRKVLLATGLTKGEFASRADIDGPKLAKSLAGKRRFTSLELALIADLGQTTVDWLLTGNETRQIVFAHRAAEHALQASDLAGREEIEKLVERREALAFLERSMPVPELPSAGSQGGWLRQATSLAAKFLTAIGKTIGGMTNLDLMNTIESRFGVDIVVKDLPLDCDGLSFADGDSRVIILATTDAPFRQRFTLAHELAHIAFGDARHAVIEEKLYVSKTTAERRANAFAASFLASRQEIEARLAGREASDCFDSLVLHFQLSPDAMAWRLFNEKLIDDDERQRLQSSTARVIAMRAGEAAEHTVRARLAQSRRPPQRLLDSYLDAYRDGLTTLRPAASLLDVPVEELETYFVDRASADDGSPLGLDA